MSRINHRGWYHYDLLTRDLWVVPPKCGSTSFSDYFTRMVRYQGVDIHPWVECKIVVRHPFERAVSALSMMKIPLTTQGVIQNINNSHLRPYTQWLNGREAKPVNLHDLVGIFPGYPHHHQGNHPHWWDTDIDWDRIYPLYREDFELCPDWLPQQEE